MIFELKKIEEAPRDVSSNTLTIVIDGSELQEVRLNGADMSDVLYIRDRDEPFRKRCAGKFGLYNLNSDGVFYNVTVNGRPVEMYDPRSQSPAERPRRKG